MYKEYFGFIEMPFSIVPNARYLFLSSRHREAMNHLQAGLGEGGGFAMLTGEVGTGKTTVSKAMLASLTENIRAGLILNPTFSASDLLEAICDEFAISYPQSASLKQLNQAIAGYLHANHDQGIQTLLLIDEAQHLSPEVLEQLRLLTNLETDSQKLLKVLLVGQPELQAKLQTSELRQLAQRITGRYHLLPLTEQEIAQYIQFRLTTAGVDKPLFVRKAQRIIARETGGVPRLINLVCDKALQYAFYAGEPQVTASLASKACSDVMTFQVPASQGMQTRSRFAVPSPVYAMLAGIGLLAAAHQFTPQWQTLVEEKLPVQAELQAQAQVQVQAPEEAAISSLSPPVPQFSWPADFVYSAGQVEAMQALYRLWGIRASVLEAECTAASQTPFNCERRYGTLEQIEKSGKPVVLILGAEERPLYAVLYASYNDQVELLSGTQRIRLSRSILLEHWQGEYINLWYQAIDQTLKQGMQGEEVRRLDSMLATALQEQPLDTAQFDMRLASRVKAFQAWQGLDVDGIAGRNTLRRLDRLTNGNAPVLRSNDLSNGEMQ